MASSRSSPGLRKRQPTPDGNEKKSVLHIPVHSAGTQQTIIGRALLILLSVAISLFFFFRDKSARTIADIPETYALCSPDGDNIYTVDDIIPRAQCLVVRDAKFVDIGSIGICDFLMHPVK